MAKFDLNDSGVVVISTPNPTSTASRRDFIWSAFLISNQIYSIKLLYCLAAPGAGCGPRSVMVSPSAKVTETN